MATACMEVITIATDMGAAEDLLQCDPNAYLLSTLYETTLILELNMEDGGIVVKWFNC